MIDSEEALQVVQLYVLSILIECILYGGFLVLMIITLVATFRKTITLRIICIHVIGLMMFCLASVHVMSHVHQIFRGLGGRGGILGEFNIPTFLLQQVISGIQFILGDASWLYRLHIVWEGNKRVTYPFAFLLISTTALGVYSTVRSVTGTKNAEASIPHEIRTNSIALLVMALASSIGFTVLITFRVCFVNWQVKKWRNSGVGQARSILKYFITLVIESGAIYSASLLLYLVTLVRNSSLITIPNEAIIQVGGIVYYMMLFQSTLPPQNQYPQTQMEVRNSVMRPLADIEVSSSIEAPRPVFVHVKNRKETYNAWEYSKAFA